MQWLRLNHLSSQFLHFQHNELNAVPLSEPSDIENLTVVSMTTDTVSLSWSKSEGDRDFYLVHIKDMDSEKDSEKDPACKSEEYTITGLTPGNKHTFTVTAIVNNTTRSAPVNISDVYTSKCRTIHA